MNTCVLPEPESIAQSVAEDIQGKQQHRQKSAGHQQYPGRRFHFACALGDQSPQARVRFLDAQSEKAQEAFEHDDLRHGERGVDDDGSDDIRDHVFGDDAGGARPRGDRGLDEFSPANAHSLTAHDARHGEPAHRADRQEQQRFAAAEDDGQEYDEKNQRQSAQDFNDPHHHMVGAPADIARDGAVADADRQTDRARHHAHGQRDARALEGAREQIASQPIGTEPMCALQRGLRRHVQPIQGLAAVGIEPRPEQRQRDQPRGDEQRAHGAGIRSQTARGIGD